MRELRTCTHNLLVSVNCTATALSAAVAMYAYTLCMTWAPTQGTTLRLNNWSIKPEVRADTDPSLIFVDLGSNNLPVAFQRLSVHSLQRHTQHACRQSDAGLLASATRERKIACHWCTSHRRLAAGEVAATA